MRSFIGHVAGQDTLGTLNLVRFHTPELVPLLQPGHFVLVRLLPTWDPYMRVPLFPVAIGHTTWQTYIPAETSFALDLLARMPAGTPVQLWGPYGTPFPSLQGSHNVLIVAQELYVPYALGLMQRHSREGNVVLLVERTGAALPEDLGWVPPAVEVYTVAAETGALEEKLETLEPWADHLFFVGPRHWPYYFAHWLEEHKMRLEPGVAYALISDGITCGLGLCDTCLLETERGWTRACRKGPVFDLAEWFAHRRRGA